MYRNMTREVEAICAVGKLLDLIVLMGIENNIGAGNNLMVGMTVACAVAVEEAMK